MSRLWLFHLIFSDYYKLLVLAVFVADISVGLCADSLYKSDSNLKEEDLLLRHNIITDHLVPSFKEQITGDKQVTTLQQPLVSQLTPPNNSYPSFADIIEPLMPAVVNIYTVKYHKVPKKPAGDNFETFPFGGFNDFFEQFNMPFSFEEMYSDPKAVSLGSGFIIAPEGYVVTNHHVINDADEISVKLSDNSELKAKLVGSDKKTDLALLKIESKTALPFVKFGDSTQARVGDWLVAIGNPFGLGGSVTTGIISSKGRDIDISSGSIVDNFIQTDAAINSGNSGGPMFNLQGEVIGVSTAIFSPSGTNIGIGFAIPSNTAQVIVEQLKHNGKIVRGRLDITIQEITGDIAEGLGLSEPVGALVAEVIPHGAADKAGIKSGDVIIEFDDKPVKNSRKLQIVVAETPIDKVVNVALIRAGKKMTLQVRVTDNENLTVNANKDYTKDSVASGGIFERNGVVFSDVTDELRKKYAIKSGLNGVIVTSIQQITGKNYGLKVGDLLVAVNQHILRNVYELEEHFNSAIANKKQHVVMLVKRRNMDIFIAVPVK